MKKGERLEEVRDKKSQSESQLKSCDTRKQDILQELNKSKDLMRQQDQLRRNIEDNLNYRKTKSDVDELACEIEYLEEKKLKIGGFSAVEAELGKLSQERERLLSEVYEISHILLVLCVELALPIFLFIKQCRSCHLLFYMIE